MPSYLCKCSKRIDYTKIPADASYHLVADEDVDILEDIVTHTAQWQKGIQVLRCPQCDRLWVFWQGFGSAPTEYVNAGIDERPPR
ncbi:MAG: hypothetical protein AMXMBFR13_51440 [Phycisphaerae bacterium]